MVTPILNYLKQDESVSFIRGRNCELLIKNVIKPLLESKNEKYRVEESNLISLLNEAEKEIERASEEEKLDEEKYRREIYQGVLVQWFEKMLE